MQGLPFYRPAEGLAGWGMPMAPDRVGDFDFRAGAAVPSLSLRSHDPSRALPPGWLA